MIGGRNAFRFGLCNYVVDCEKQAKRSKGDDGVDTATSVRDEESATAVKEEHTEGNEGKVLEENLDENKEENQEESMEENMDENKEENKEENKVGIKEGEHRDENRNANLSRKSKVDFKDGVDRKSKVLSFAVRIAREISEGAPVATSAAFAAVKGASSHSETICYNLCLGEGDKDRREALAAFKEKRKPRFSGRESHVEFVKLEELETARHRAGGGEGVEGKDAELRKLLAFPSQLTNQLRQRHRTPEEEADRALMKLERNVERLEFEEQKLTNRFNAILKKTTKFLEHMKLHPGERDRYMNNMNSTNKHMEDMLTRKDQLKGVGKAEGSDDVMYRKTNRDPSRRQYPPQFGTKRPSYLSNLDTPEGKAKYQEMRSLRRRVNMLKRRERWLKEQFHAIHSPSGGGDILSTGC